MCLATQPSCSFQTCWFQKSSLNYPNFQVCRFPGVKASDFGSVEYFWFGSSLMADASVTGCTSVSWSWLSATVSLGALPGPQNLVRSLVLPAFRTCRLCCGASSPVMSWVSWALRHLGNAAITLCLSTGLQSAEHPWIALPGSVRAPSMPSLGLVSPTIEEPADRGKPNPPLSP